MENLANITIKESDYQSLLLNGALLDIRVISVKIMPNDEVLKDDPIYKELQKKYIKARNDFEDYKFKKINNVK